jgi:folate-dependent tRNA-U54 methylase TrmFO/GidA
MKRDEFGLPYVVVKIQRDDAFYLLGMLRQSHEFSQRAGWDSSVRCERMIAGLEDAGIVLKDDAGDAA